MPLHLVALYLFKMKVTKAQGAIVELTVFARKKPLINRIVAFQFTIPVVGKG